MQTPVQIAFHGIDTSDAIETRIKDKVAKLEHYFDRITSCRVTVEREHKHHPQGNHYHVKGDLTVPG